MVHQPIFMLRRPISIFILDHARLSFQQVPSLLQQVSFGRSTFVLSTASALPASRQSSAAGPPLYSHYDAHEKSHDASGCALRVSRARLRVEARRRRWPTARWDQMNQRHLTMANNIGVGFAVHAVHAPRPVSSY